MTREEQARDKEAVIPASTRCSASDRNPPAGASDLKAGAPESVPCALIGLSEPPQSPQIGVSEPFIFFPKQPSGYMSGTYRGGGLFFDWPCLFEL